MPGRRLFRGAVSAGKLAGSIGLCPGALGRNPDVNVVGPHILGGHSGGTDHTVASHSHAGEHGGVVGDPDVVFEHATRQLAPCTAIWLGGLMAGPHEGWSSSSKEFPQTGGGPFAPHLPVSGSFVTYMQQEPT